MFFPLSFKQNRVLKKSTKTTVQCYFSRSCTCIDNWRHHRFSRHVRKSACFFLFLGIFRYIQSCEYNFYKFVIGYIKNPVKNLDTRFNLFLLFCSIISIQAILFCLPKRYSDSVPIQCYWDQRSMG